MYKKMLAIISLILVTMYAQITCQIPTYTLKQDEVLFNRIKITQSYIIDGLGKYNITLEDGAYILIDNPNNQAPITITFKNMKISGLKDYIISGHTYKKSIDCGDNKNQFLVFENVDLLLEDNFSLPDFFVSANGVMSVFGHHTLSCAHEITLGPKSRLSVKPQANIKYLK